MKKLFAAFLAFFLAFSPLLSVSPTVYAEAFNQSTVTSDGQATTEAGTETTEAGNGSEATNGEVTTTAPLVTPSTVTTPPATQAPATVASTEAPASQEATTESKPASQPAVAFRSARTSVTTTTNLAELLKDVTLDATTDADGNYVVRPNGEYTISLKFAETETLQMDNDQPLTYTVPAGFSLANFNNTFAIEIKDSQGTATLSGNTFSVNNNVVTINFNKSDAALFARLAAMANVEFSLSFKGRFTANSDTIQFNSRITRKFTFDQTSNLKISKDAVHAARNATKVDYTLKVTSEGNNTNVVISDTIVGTALKLNQDVVVTSSIKGPLTVQPVYDLANDTFTISGINLEHEEVLTITYSANILFGELTNAGLEAETKNIATVKSDENPDPKTVEKWLQIVYDGLIKRNSGATPISGEANKYQVNWTFEYNKAHLLTAGGKKMVDALTVPDRSYFTGTGIKITVTKEDGSVEVRNLTWSQLTGIKRRASDNQIYQWEYNIPESDGKAAYRVEATAIVDKTGAVANVVAGNYIRIDKLSTSNSVSISSGIGEEMKPTKTAVSVNSQEIVWKITVPVPATGYNHLVRLIDDLPYAIVGVTQYHDQAFEYIVEGLLPGETYTISDRVTGQYRGPDIHFYQNEGKTVEGLLPSPDGQMRHVTITIKTKVNQDWLQMAHDQGYVAVTGGINPIHTNNFTVIYGTDRFSGIARATPKKQTIKKVYKSDRKEEIGGVTYPVFTYEIEVSNPLDGEVIKDTFNTEYLKYYSGGQLTVKGKIDGTDTTDDNGTVTATNTSTGVDITLTNLPKKANGSYYSTYIISYDLIVKDEATLNTLNQRAFQNEGIKLSNVAAWNGLNSEEVSVIYHYNPMVDKHLIQDPKDSNSYVATFELVLNEGADDIVPNQPVYTVKDVLSDELRFLPDTLQVVSGNYTLDYGFDRETNTLTLKNVPDNEKVVIQYSARVLGLGNVSFHNTVSIGEYVKTVTSSVAIASTGSGTASNPSITVIKRDQDNYNKVIPGVTFALSYLDASGSAVPVNDKNGNQVTFTTGADGTFLIEGNQTNLGWVLWKDRTYLLTETTTPTGYTPLTEPVKFVLTDNIQNQSQYDISGEVIDVTNERPKTEIQAKKIWKNVGPGVQVPTTWFKLYRKIAGGNLEEVPISEAPVKELAPGTTTVTWTNLYAQDLNASPYSFEVKEVDAAGNPVTPQDYLKEESGLQVTNTYDGRKEIEVTKVWNDNSNQDGKRPSEVTVHLFADGVKIQTVQVTEADGWKYTFTNLPRFKDSQEIVYTVQEDQVAGYQAPAIDGFTITNKRIPEKTKVTVNKIWDDANNQDGIRPLFITAILKANGIEIDRLVITAGPDGSWKGEFTNLDVYRNGVKVDYTVDEEVVPADYTKTITGDTASGFTIKNSHKPVEKKVTFSKVDLDGVEIAGAQIKIYKGTTATGTPVAEWTSVQDQSHELSLPVGTYVFHEEAAPNGYLAVTDITFQVNYDGTVTVLDAQSNSAVYKGGKLVITDQYDETPKKITFSKVNLGGDEVEGAEIEIYAGDTVTGTPVEKWTSGTTPKELNLAPGTYVFHEEAAPNGLLKVTDITFKVDYQGNVTVTNIGQKDAKGEDNIVVTDGSKITITDKTDDLPRKITFSKVNLGGDEVDGAEVEIYAGDTVTGTPVEKWTSGTTPKELNLAPGTYVFHEEAAPNGLLKVTDITFKVNYDGTVTVTNIGEKDTKGEDNKVVTDGSKITITDKTDDLPRKITFSKVNLGGEEIASAEIEIYAGDKAEGTPIEKWTSEAGKSKIIDLKPGIYVFHEEAAPNGLLKVTDITFKVDYQGNVTVTNIGQKDAKGEDNKVVTDGSKITITDKTDDIPRKITFSKVNLGGDEVEGAEVEIYAGDKVEGTPVEKWTSGTSPKELNLKPGTYVFHEEAAPNGLLKVTDITFQVNYDGTVTVTNIGQKDAKGEDNKVVTDGSKITITDKTDDLPRKITFSKVNLGGEEIAGAEIEIYAGDKAEGTPVEKWTSEAGKSKELNLKPGIYVFHEVAAPNGLLKVTDITFQVGYDGNVTVTNIGQKDAKGEDNQVVTDGSKITITDKTDDIPRKITFSKVNLGGEEIAGAEIEIYAGDKAEGTPVEKWTSEAGKSKELNLKPGIYVFHEVAAPNGYVAVTDITFQVNYDGTVTVLNTNSNAVEYKDGKLVITDQYDESPKKITFSKVNLGGEEIAGAEIEIYAGDKAEGTPVEKWTSEAGKSKELNLKPGIYVFHEVAAPNGYVAVTDITFQVNYDGTVTVLNTNSNAVEYKDGKLVITDQYDESPKKITFSKVNLGGEEIAGAEIEIYAGDKAEGTPVEKWTSEAGKSKELNLKPGIYVFHEVAAPNGYVAVTDITFQVNYDGTVTVLNTNSNAVEYKDGKLVITDQYDESPKKITFSKVNLGGEEIAGAEIEIYAGDKAEGTPVEKWTSEAGKSKELNLKPGIYVFHEEAAPNGYVAVTDITFQVNYDGTVTVLETNSNAVEFKDGKLVITDQYDETTIDILVTKKWDDQDNKAGKRPEKITVRLLADGKEVASQDLTAKNDWKHTFTKLPKYKNGKEIVYTITEDKVEGYQTDISGSVAKGFVVQNTYTPPVPPPSTSVPKAKVKKNTLPRTGDSQSLLLSGIGFVILLVGLGGYSWKKRF